MIRRWGRQYNWVELWACLGLIRNDNKKDSSRVTVADAYKRGLGKAGLCLKVVFFGGGGVSGTQKSEYQFGPTRFPPSYGHFGRGGEGAPLPKKN